jgi:hypothetical protein
VSESEGPDASEGSNKSGESGDGKMDGEDDVGGSRKPSFEQGEQQDDAGESAGELGSHLAAVTASRSPVDCRRDDSRSSAAGTTQ